MKKRHFQFPKKNLLKILFIFAFLFQLPSEAFNGRAMMSMGKKIVATAITATWTWINGSNTTGASSSYGTQGVPNSGYTHPTSRTSSLGWTDSSGKLWLFGGADSHGSYNDLWKYDPSTNQWTWMTGSNVTGATSVYGTQGVAAAGNTPGARSASVGWVDGSGKLWLFGGVNGGYRNDLWKYDPSTNLWTWMGGTTTAAGVYGTQGVADPGNFPGARRGATAWTDTSGKFWLFGGSAGSGSFSDLWKYDPGTSQWMWVSGSNTTGVSAVYGTQGTAAAGNTPGARSSAVGWTNIGGKLWLFGGGSGLNDLWQYDPGTNQWTWMNGSSAVGAAGVYGTQGVAAPGNTPSGRSNMTSWTDSNGKFWLFGGTYGASYYNDLWQYDPATNQWTWMNGSSGSSYTAGVYGTQGVAAAGNFPGSRSQPTSWTDSSGKLWLFGGYGYFNDLWKYDPTTNQWAWINGPNTSGDPGLYGTQGSPGAGMPTFPGNRSRSATWTDSTGKFWLFGGYNSVYLDDIWQYDKGTNQWTWMGGSTSGNTNAIYGTQGVAAASNMPAGRYGCANWIDSSGKLWIFGGSQASNIRNDLWVYDPSTTQWTWISGSNSTNAPGVYGTQGVAAAGNIPGARLYSLSWTDSAGKFWLFGGNLNASNSYNDLWKYDPTTNQWTWMTGSTTTNAAGVYGTQGAAAGSNTPGARYRLTGWIDSSDKLWLFGGYNSNGADAYNDLWKYDPITNQWTWMTGSNTSGAAGVYGTQSLSAPTNIPGSRVGTTSWVDNSGKFWLFGGYKISLGYFNDLWSYDPSTNQWAWVSGSNSVAGAGVYGTLGVGASGNTPGARAGAGFWKDSSGKFWLFGGNATTGSDGTGSALFYSDLWKITSP